ncbi:MAG: glycosyltransferase family 2 protein [Legionella sp.]|uniref:glycosyltransferase family 2 protein n=1 Tax=Legionella sp. TaxID=459 RepID=UPI0039E47CB9
MANELLITIAVPSFNQAPFLDAALASIFKQNLPIEVFVVDGGSTDGSLAIIRKWEKHLSGWRSHTDAGQAAAINEGIAAGTSPYVCWLNSDDWLLPNGLNQLVRCLEEQPYTAAAYGRSWNFIERSKKNYPVWVEPFNEKRLALRCIISQPATLIRRTAWEAINGLNPKLHMAMDYDLWWRLYRNFGPPRFVDNFIAVNREHANTKTKTQRRLHYKEAMQIVRKQYGSVPLKWWLAQPYSVWFKSLFN